MSNNMFDLALIVASLAVLAIGYFGGFIAIMGGSVSKTKNPVLYWSAMALTLFIGLVGVVLMIFQK